MRTWPCGPVDAARWLAFDTASTALLREVIAQHGWPGASVVGPDGAQAAWLMAQHSPDLPCQREVLAPLRAQLPGEVAPELVAFLRDRVCVREQRPQRYVTQVRPDGHPFDLEPGDVDARRFGIGLEPLEVYLAPFRP